MRQNRKLLKSLIAFFAMCLFLWSPSAVPDAEINRGRVPRVPRFPQSPSEPIDTDVSFSSSSLSCSLSGTYFKKIYPDGNVVWDPSEPSSATVSASGTAEGTGYAAAELFYGSLNGTVILSSRDRERVGEWGYTNFRNPFADPGTASPSASFTLSNLSTGAGTYTWSASGRFYTQGVNYTGTEWEDKAESHSDAISSGE